jgi:hypothetical protein
LISFLASIYFEFPMIVRRVVAGDTYLRGCEVASMGGRVVKTTTIRASIPTGDGTSTQLGRKKRRRMAESHAPPLHLDQSFAYLRDHLLFGQNAAFHHDYKPGRFLYRRQFLLNRVSPPARAVAQPGRSVPSPSSMRDGARASTRRFGVHFRGRCSVLESSALASPGE